MAHTLSIRPAATAVDFDIMRSLLREYAGYLNDSLGEEHICLSDYEKELANLPGQYAQPKGVIILAFAGDQPAGCVALKPLKPERAPDPKEAACEMKRLWVRTSFRGQSIGLALAKELISYARSANYTSMYLDTVPGAMKAANSIYHNLGFEPVERYNTNPILGINPAVSVEFFRLWLQVP
jgi:GNAT superfamily N-acetyltransferase